MRLPVFIVAVASFFAGAASVEAMPSFARAFKQQYGYMPSCNACHHDGGGSRLNAYGEAFKQAGKTNASFTSLAATDSDGDGDNNGAEAQAKANPGDKASTVAAPGKPPSH